MEQLVFFEGFFMVRARLDCFERSVSMLLAASDQLEAVCYGNTAYSVTA